MPIMIFYKAFVFLLESGGKCDCGIDYVFPNIFFVGEISPLTAIFRRLQCYILPVYRGVFPLVISTPAQFDLYFDHTC